MKSTVCFYHRNCLDGFGSAFAMWLALGQSSVEYIPIQYGEKILERDVDCRDVYMVDFSIPPGDVQRLSHFANSITIIDHHDSAVRKFDGFNADEAHCPVKLVFDTDHSGAVLTWKHFHPGQECPELLKLIEDRDLWNWKYGERTRNVNAALWLNKFDFGEWEKARRALPMLEAKGSVLNQDLDSTLDNLEPLAQMMLFAGHTVPVINVTAKFASELGNRLCMHHPFAVMWYMDHKEKKAVFSLRSNIKSGGIKVNDLAHRFGGGGHPQAAGMAMSIEDPRFTSWLHQRWGEDTTLDSEETPWL